MSPPTGYLTGDPRRQEVEPLGTPLLEAMTQAIECARAHPAGSSPTSL